MSKGCGAISSLVASAGRTRARSPSASAAMLARIASSAGRARSTRRASAAPRESASRPTAPVPANRSRNRLPRSGGTPCSSMLSRASRARSLVGRVSRPGGATSRRPRCRPATIRTKPGGFDTPPALGFPRARPARRCPCCASRSSAAAASAGCTPDNIAAHPKAQLASTYDVAPPSAEAVAERARGEGGGLGRGGALDPAVDAVLIASSTDTHVELITAAAKAGKAILCEKPIDLDIGTVDACWKEIGALNRADHDRLQPPLRPVLRGAARGDPGRARSASVEQVVITSRDPGPPPVAYIKVSGGLFRDMTIHDFDMARFLLGEHGRGDGVRRRNLIDPGDRGRRATSTPRWSSCAPRAAPCATSTTAAAAPMATTSGSRCSARRACCRPATAARRRSRRWGAERTEAEDPVLDFFIERYREAYVAEIDHFIDCVSRTGRRPGRLRGRARGAAPRRRRLPLDRDRPRRERQGLEAGEPQLTSALTARPIATQTGTLSAQPSAMPFITRKLS